MQMGRPRIQNLYCAIEGCNRTTQALNRCSNHYAQWKNQLPYWPIAHGTLNAWSNLKCRCHECREAANAYHKEHYSKLGLGPRPLGSPEVNLDVPKPFYEIFKGYCQQRHRSMRSVALEAVETYMRDNP